MRGICYVLIFIGGCATDKETYMPAYVPFSPTVAHLRVYNHPVDSLSVSAAVVTIIPWDLNESNTVTVREAGQYFLNMEIDRPAKSSLNLNGKQYNLFLFPHDTTHIEINVLANDVKLSFDGKTKEINEYYLEKARRLGYTDTRFPLNKVLSSKPTYRKLKHYTDSVINQELSFFEGYTTMNQLPEWFLDYEKSEIIYMGAGYKTAMPTNNELMKYFKDTLPGDYYDYLKSVEIDNPKAILTTQYFAFLNEYFLKDFPAAQSKQLAGFSRTSKMMSHKLDQAKDQLSGDVKRLYYKSNFSFLIKFYTDSATIDSLARALRLSDYKELVRIAGTRSRNEIEMLNMNRGDTIPDFILTNHLDSLVSIRAFQDQILYVNFWATWCGPCIHNMPELNKMIKLYDGNPNLKFLNICVDSEREKWLASVKKLEIQGENLFASGNWNSKLRAYFNITGIPHYVIIELGNILFENATDKAPQVQHKIDAMLAKQTTARR